jgi:hypothetical protein
VNAAEADERYRLALMVSSYSPANVCATPVAHANKQPTSMNRPARPPRPKKTEVLWNWPGLPHHAYQQPVSHPLRTDMRDALPEMTTPDGWRRIRTLLTSNDPAGRWPWPSLSTLAARLAPPVDDDTPSY